MNGKRKGKGIKTKIMYKNIQLDLHVVNANLTLSKHDLNLDRIWPNLDRNLKNEVKRNIFGGPIDIIIGIDLLYTKVLRKKSYSHVTRGLNIKDTIFGNSIGGSTDFREKLLAEPIVLNCFATSIEKISTEPTIIDENNCSQDEEDIQKNISKMFEFNNYMDNPKSSKIFCMNQNSQSQESDLTMDEQYAVQQFNESITMRDGRYFVKPILIRDFVPMKNNYFVALRRYKALRHQLSKDKAIEEMYSSAIQTLIDNKEVVKVEESYLEASDQNRYLNYIPHLAVVKKDRITTKCRPVFDASSKNYDGISLNSNLLQGPKTQPALQILLTHLRMNPIVLIADIARMYYAIKYLGDCDEEKTKMKDIRDLYRFLWHEDPKITPSVLNFTSVLISARDSPFVVNATIQHHLDKIILESKDPDEIAAAKLVKTKIYILVLTNLAAAISSGSFDSRMILSR